MEKITKPFQKVFIATSNKWDQINAYYKYLNKIPLTETPTSYYNNGEWTDTWGIWTKVQMATQKWKPKEQKKADVNVRYKIRNGGKRIGKPGLDAEKEVAGNMLKAVISPCIIRSRRCTFPTNKQIFFPTTKYNLVQLQYIYYNV